MTDHSLGKPADKSYLECDLPPLLQKSLEQMKQTWARLDAGEEYLQWDMDWAELNADINSAEVNQAITSEQAWYLREKYLGMRREDPF